MTLTGEWFNQSSRPLMRTGGGVTDPDVRTCDVADAAVTNEKATSNLRVRSVLAVFEAATSTEAAGQVRPCSTGNVVWRPLVPVEVLRIQRISLGAEEMATCDNFVVYGNAGTCVGGILLKTGSTAPAAYTRTDGGALTRTALAACTNVLVQRLSSTCSVQARSIIQIDYESSG